MNIQIVLVKPM